jgi:hypothetical protein
LLENRNRGSVKSKFNESLRGFIRIALSSLRSGSQGGQKHTSPSGNSRGKARKSEIGRRRRQRVDFVGNRQGIGDIILPIPNHKGYGE